MALSGSLKTRTWNGNSMSAYLQFSWTATQSIDGNTSTISWSLKGVTTGSWVMSGGFKVVIDDETVYSKNTDYRIKLYDGTLVASGTKTFDHKADGTRTFTVYVEAGIYTYAVNCNGSETFTLTTIARASQPSCVTYPNNTENVGEFGSTITIYMNRKSTDFTHTVRYVYGNLSKTCIDADTGKEATGVKDNVRWKIPESFMDLIPNDVRGSGTIYVDTYKGTTFIGTKQCVFTATVPASVVPSVEVAVADAEGHLATYGAYVQGWSKLQITATPTLAYSSPIKTYAIAADGKTYGTNPVTADVLQGKDKLTITAKVTDNRSRPSEVASIDITVLEYSKPSVTPIAYRCNSSGEADPEGAFMRIGFEASITSLNDKNSARYTVACMGHSFSGTGTSYLSEILECDISRAWSVEVTVSDDLDHTTKAAVIPIAFTLMDFYHTGMGVALGKVATRDGFDCAMPAYFTGAVYIGDKLLADYIADLVKG